ncbi:hypothetical protein BC827DRAFT_1199768 [Russula dissimulans]|nr:hypothetical protein BC827DRAFT_1199768 [Russula dissimulans]
MEIYSCISVMANLIRSAKSGNDWTQNELRAYNIQVVEQSLVEFFNQNQLPPVPPTVRHFCETTDRALAPDDDTYKLLHYLDLAQNPKVWPGSRCWQLRGQTVGDVGVRVRSPSDRYSSGPSFDHLRDAMLSSDGRLYL